MSSKLHIPSLEEMDEMKRSSGKQLPSHFKAGNSTRNNNNRSAELESGAGPQIHVPDLPLKIDKTISSTSIVTKSNKSDKPSLIKPILASDTATANAAKIVSVEKTVSASIPVAALSSVESTTLGTANLSSKVESVGLKSLTDGGIASSIDDNNTNAGSSRPAKLNSIIVSSRQKGNPILKFVRRVPWEFGDIVPDYQIGPTSCVLYLSLKYHNLNPNYIHERLKHLANSFSLRVLLAQVDVKDPHHSLKELAAMCILADCTLILAFTPEEAGRYLETYKSFESKPPDLIMEKSESNYMAKMTDTLTSVTKVNKTDAVTLLSAFGSFAKLTEVSEEDLSLCPGVGPQKARRLHKVFHQPFIKDLKSKSKKTVTKCDERDTLSKDIVT